MFFQMLLKVLTFVNAPKYACIHWFAFTYEDQTYMT